MRQPNQLKPNKVNKIRSMLKDGASYASISRTVHCSVSTVSSYAIKMGLGRRFSNRKISESQSVEIIKRYKDGATLKQLADVYGVHFTTILTHIRKEGIRTYNKCDKHDSEGFPKGRPPEFTKDMFSRAIDESKEIEKVGEEYADNYKRLIFHRAKQVKDYLGIELYTEIEKWASATE